MSAPAGSGPRIRVGTRASTLARAQTDLVATALEAAGAEIEIVVIATDGDRSQAANTPIASVGVGVFVTALRDALLADEIDVAVHSYKDLPTASPQGLLVAAVPSREDPRDALVARDRMVLGELPPGAVVGTGSPRRAAQLDALGLGLQVVPIRGNVDTRIGKVTDGQLDAVVLARAGLARLGRLREVTEVLDPLQMLPAPAQGAMAVECRVADTDLEALLRRTLHDDAAGVAVAAERSVLATIGGGCHEVVGALADVVEDLDDDGSVVERLSLRAMAATPDGALLRASGTGETKDAEQLGRSVAGELLADGAGPAGPAAPTDHAPPAENDHQDGTRTDDR